MDVVKLSAAGAAAACAALALLSSTRNSCAETPVVLAMSRTSPVVIPRPRSQAFRPAARSLAFSLSGPVPPSAGPTIYGASLFPRPRFVGAPSSQNSPWDTLVDEASRRFNIPPSWVRGVMQIESGGRRSLNGRPTTSSAGAMGLMQVMPSTFAELTGRYDLGGDPHEPRANILAGTAYLREMYDRYGLAHFLAAYNAGPGRVDDHLRRGRPLPPETQRYVQLLAPQLVGSTGDAGSAPSSNVCDMTSADAMRGAALPPSRAFSASHTSPEAAPLFVTANSRPPARDRHDHVQPSDGLFVTLVPPNPRQDRTRADNPEN